MQHESAHEFIGIELHDLLPIAIGVVAPSKAHGATIEVNQTVVGDGDLVSVPTQIGDDVFDTFERWFGIHHPVVFEQLRLQGFKLFCTACQVQFSFAVRLLKEVNVFTTEHLRQGAHREQEPVLGPDPPIRVLGECPTGDNGVHMDVLA